MQTLATHFERHNLLGRQLDHCMGLRRQDQPVSLDRWGSLHSAYPTLSVHLRRWRACPNLRQRQVLAPPHDRQDRLARAVGIKELATGDLRVLLRQTRSPLSYLGCRAEHQQAPLQAGTQHRLSADLEIWARSSMRSYRTSSRVCW